MQFWLSTKYKAPCFDGKQGAFDIGESVFSIKSSLHSLNDNVVFLAFLHQNI